MTQYLLAVHRSRARPLRRPRRRCRQAFKAVDTFNAKLQDAGRRGCSAAACTRPTPPPSSTPRSGDVLITDGPSPRPRSSSAASGSSTPPDLDAALSWAAEGSVACGGPVEVRPFQDEPEA